VTDLERYRSFLAGWLVHVGERAVRIFAFLKSTSLETGNWEQVPPVLARLEHETLAHLAEVRATYADLRADRALSLAKAAATAGRIIDQHLRRHLSLHAKLAVIPRAWIHSEIGHFLRRAARQLSPDARRRVGIEADVLDTFTVISTSDYDFAGVPTSAEIEQKGGAERFSSLENVLTIPMIEQGNVMFWGNLVRELCRSVIAHSGVKAEVVSTAAFGQLPGGMQTVLSESWIEEIACDLLASDLIGPQYYVSFVDFCLNWTVEPHCIPTGPHPSPDARMGYIRRRLEATNVAFLGAFDEALTARRALRAGLDAERGSDALRHVATGPEAPAFPPNEVVMQMADAIAGSGAYRAMLGAPYAANPSHVRHLRTRFARGEFIATSRRAAQADDPSGCGIEAKDFEKQVADLVEAPNDVFDITTACILHLSDLVPSEPGSEERRGAGDRVPSLRDSMHEIFAARTGLADAQFARELELYLRRLDGTVSKSLEVREIAAFLQQAK
jgi:hypothetical protein